MFTPGMKLYWLTEDHVVEICHDMEMWGQWMEEPSNRRVAETTLHDDRWVSTVFLGIDHLWHATGRPVVFETMVFEERGHTGDQGQATRYCTWDESYAGHWRVVREETLYLVESSNAC
jgi:hypothetical protein